MDDEAVKAEKLAAAKKRFEELKKKKSKKVGGGGAKASSKAESDKPADEKQKEDAAPPPAEEPAETPASPPRKATPSSPTGSPKSPVAHARTASIQTRRASASQSHLRRPSISAAELARSATKSPLSPTDVPDIYRRQAETISGLTEENEKLITDVEVLKVREKQLHEVETERDKLLEQLSNVREEVRGLSGKIKAAEGAKAKREEEAEMLRSETTALNRQVSHLTSQVTAKEKTISDLRLRASGSSDSPDDDLLAAKEDQIENMELELSRLRSELGRSQKALAAAESTAKSRDSGYDALQEEISKLHDQLGTAQEQVSQGASKQTETATKLRALEKEVEALRSENRKKADHITSLEKDYNTLKTMYRDAETKHQEASRLASARGRETQELEDALAESRRKASQLEAQSSDLKLKLDRALLENRRLTGANPADDDAVDELEDAGRNELREKVRTLEEALEQQRHINKQFQRQRAASMASTVLSEDDADVDFGELMKKEMAAARAKEEAARQKAIAAEEERKRQEQERLERIREVKKGLENWKGWKMDLTLAGGSSGALGQMFEV